MKLFAEKGPASTGTVATTAVEAGLGALWDDVRRAIRVFVTDPGFAAAAILSLALGIGASTAIFSVTNALLLRPLPYADPDRLVILWNRSPGLGITEDWFSTAQYFDIKTGHRSFEQFAIAFGNNLNLTGDGEPERVGVVRVSSGLLPMLGVTAAAGRIFVAEEDAPGRPATALLTYGLWVRRYGADPGIIGRTITLNGQLIEVVGVLPQQFSLPREVLPTLYGGERADIFLPLPLTDAAPRTRDREDYNIVGKLRMGVSVREAQAELDAITARLRRDFPDLYPPNGGLTFSIVPLREQVVGEVRRPLSILLGSVGLVLLAACANVANLLLARALGRQKAVAVQAALGAGRGRIVRQLLTESVLLGLCAGALGVLAASWSLNWVRVVGPRSIPRLGEIDIDGRVLLFALLVSLLSSVLFGLVPALRASRVDLNATLKETGQGSAGVHAMWGRGNRLRRLLVVAEVALSVVLLIGAGLLVRSFVRLQSVDAGFSPRGLLTFGLTLAGRQYTTPQTVLGTYRQLSERLDRLPGVSSSGGVSALPLTQIFAWTPITIEGRTPPPGEKFINADERVVAGRYFETMGIPLRRGRLFNDGDAATSPQVVIIDERMAREFWPDQDPVGRRMRRGGESSKAPWLTVVGVVGRVKHDALDSDPRIAFYLPQTQFPARAMTVVVRSGTDPQGLTASLREAIAGIDRDLPLYQVRTMEQWVELSMARRRFTMTLLGFFAGFALALAAIGIYGVMTYVVSQGQREIGIRIAVGATRGGIVGLVLRQGTLLALSGVALGLAGAFALTRFMVSLLFGVPPTDAVTFSAIPALLLAISVLACYVPARRAAGVDPVVSLRCE